VLNRRWWPPTSPTDSRAKSSCLVRLGSRLAKPVPTMEDTRRSVRDHISLGPGSERISRLLDSLIAIRLEVVNAVEGESRLNAAAASDQLLGRKPPSIRQLRTSSLPLRTLLSGRRRPLGASARDRHGLLSFLARSGRIALIAFPRFPR